MILNISTRTVLLLLLILTWIIFVGLCIDAGAFLVNAFFAIAKPAVVKILYHEVDLSGLLKYDRGHFFALVLSMAIVAVTKAIIFYQLIKMLHNKKIDLSQPFSPELRHLTFNLSYLSLLVGCFSSGGTRYAKWLEKKGVEIPDVQDLHLGGADVWIFMAVILYVIALIFKRGMEIQSENDLTV
ncbi:MAG: DUF2975 domain-containing protein [Chitinophagaceae bacterium]|nr:DUF2975 domain-containing protein [Chitinophagaceae bacterium]